VPRPTGFADLAGRRVGIFGYGVEGRAAEALLRPTAGSLVIVDDVEDAGAGVLVTSRGGLEALRTCDVVLKSPGIVRRRVDVTGLEAGGVLVTSALNLWLHDADRSRVVAITGTKGKSTVTALVTFMLRCLGQRAQGLGNFGQPPYDPSVDTSSGWTVLEVSSYQCVDLDVAPGLVVVTSLGADHLDWHGTLSQYIEDKLSLTRAEGPHRTLVPDSATFHDVAGQLGGDVTFVPADTAHLASRLDLLGAHSDSNVAMALATVSILSGEPVERIRDVATEQSGAFVPLRGRLTLVTSERRDDVEIRYVDDGLATAPLPTIAALEVFCDEPVALIVGGFDRGVNYRSLADAIARRAPATLVLTMGNAGERIGSTLHQLAPALAQSLVGSMDEAVREARTFLRHGGVVLFSPAAPSFDRYRNWEERSDDFVRAVRLLGP